MPKQLITVIGLVVSLGIIALGVVLVAVPMLLSSFAVDSQTASVAASNDVYQAQVDGLEEQEARQEEIDASVAVLRSQIPITAQLDDVFEVVANAAGASGVTITSVTAGESAAFLVRSGATDPADDPTAADAAAQTDATPSPDPSATPADGSSGTDAGATPTDVAPTGRQQVDFSIQVKATDMNQVTAFLDALRSGTRLFSSVTALSTTSGEGIEVQVDGLTFVDAEG
jgi:hypothetical protein